MKRRDAIKSVGGGLSLKWTAPVVVSVLLPQHAHASGVTPSISAEMDACEVTNGRIFAGISVTNSGSEIVQITSITSNVNILTMPSMPTVINPNNSMFLDIEGNVNDTVFRCGNTVTLSISGVSSNTMFSLEIVV